MNQIFNIKVNVMEDVNLDIISDIETKCLHNESLSEEEIYYFLNYVVYKTRFMLSSIKNKDIDNYSYDFMCDTAQSIIGRYFDKLNIDYKPVETQKAITSDVLGHSFLIADFVLNDEVKSFIIDPTFNQFFDIDKCKESEFKIINGVVIKTPYLGFFALKNDEDSQSVIKDLLKFGYMELNEENAKIYGDLFYKTKTGKINFLNCNLEMPGSIYIKGFKKSLSYLTYTALELEEMEVSLNPLCNFNLKKRV